MYAYVKNNFVKKKQATISIDERGFRFADGFFDTILISNFQPYRWQFHKDKILANLKLYKIQYDIDYIELVSKKLIQKNNFKNGLLRIYISRGVGSVGYKPKDIKKPTLVIETIKTRKQNNNNSNLWISSLKKIPNDCFPTDVKPAHALQSVLVKLEAEENNCIESLLFNDDIICEGASSNIFWVKNNNIFTPSACSPCYKGSMRAAIMDLIPNIITGKFKIDQLIEADEVFITNVALKVKNISGIEKIHRTYEKNKTTLDILTLLTRDIKEKTRHDAWQSLHF